MRRKLQNMLETWAEAGLHLRLSLVTGEIIVGRLEELDGDEVIIEPIEDGVTGPLTVVLLDHVVTASYADVNEAPDEEDDPFYDEATDTSEA